MKNSVYYFTRNLTVALPWLFSRRYQDGTGEVPRSGPALLLCTHISHFDPPFMMLGFPRVVHFMADKPLLEIPVLGRLLRWSHVFPIDRTKNDRGALKTAIARLKQGHIVGIFPERGIRHGAAAVLEGAELPLGTASLWKMMDVPVIPMVILGTDQMYALKKYPSFPRIFSRVGPLLPCDPAATREELRDRIVAAWRALYASLQRDYAIRPDELPQSAQQRWGQPVQDLTTPPAAPAKSNKA